MNFENIVKLKLSIGIAIKNYKEMCSILGEKEKKGKSRLLQIANWERYFKWHKDGQKFIIDEVFEMPIEKIDNRGKTENNKAKYLTNIEKLILNLLVQGGSLGYGKIFLSKSKILKELKMINDNYSFCKLRLPKLSEFMNIDKEVIQEWYDSTSRMLESNLDISLKNLESQSLIFWSKEITIAKAIPVAEINKPKVLKTKITDQYDEEIINYDYFATNKVVLQYREGTDNEKRFILYTEKEVLKEMNFNNKSQVIACGKWQDFIENVNNILLDKLNIAFYYKSYKIIFNIEHILEETIEINDFKLDKIDQSIEKGKLNRDIIERIEINTNNRHERAKKVMSKILGKPKNTNIIFRSKDNYIDDNNKLNDNLINSNAKDIKNDVKKIKIK